MCNRIEIRRMVIGVESCLVDVDVHESEDPHSVYYQHNTISFETD